MKGDFDKMMEREHVGRLSAKLNEAVKLMWERSMKPSPMQIPCGSVEQYLAIKEMADCGADIVVIMSCRLADELRELGHIE